MRAVSTDKLVPIPINLDTVDTLYDLQLEAADMPGWIAGRAEFVVEARTAEDVVASQAGRDLCEKISRCYTRKQWGLDPSELDAGITARGSRSGPIARIATPECSSGCSDTPRSRCAPEVDHADLTPADTEGLRLI